MKRKIAIALVAVAAVSLILSMMSRVHRKEVDVIATQRPAALKVSEQDQLKSLGYMSSGGAIPADQESTNSSSIVVRKIVRSGEITIRVKTLDTFLRALEKQAQMSGGYVAGMVIDRGDGGASALVTLKVQPESVNSMVWWLKEQGNIDSEKLNAEDISEQYYDLKARLQNAHKFEARLQEMVGTHSGKLSDLLALEEKLSQIRESIETMEGQMRTYDHLVNLATFVIRVSVERPSLAPHKARYSERAIRAWGESTGALADFIRAIGLAVVVVLPWIALLIPPALLLRYLLIRRRSLLPS